MIQSQSLLQFPQHKMGGKGKFTLFPFESNKQNSVNTGQLLKRLNVLLWCDRKDLESAFTVEDLLELEK